MINVSIVLLIFKKFENVATKFLFFAAVGTPKHIDLSNLNILEPN